MRILLLLMIVCLPTLGWAQQYDLHKLGRVDILRGQLFDEMPNPSDVDFDPIDIEVFRTQLESHRALVIEGHLANMMTRCQYLVKLDGQIRTTMIPVRMSWDDYSFDIQPMILAEISFCDAENPNSEYTSLYRAAIKQYQDYVASYKNLVASCAVSPRCIVGN